MIKQESIDFAMALSMCRWRRAISAHKAPRTVYKHQLHVLEADRKILIHRCTAKTIKCCTNLQALDGFPLNLDALRRCDRKTQRNESSGVVRILYERIVQAQARRSQQAQSSGTGNVTTYYFCDFISVLATSSTRTVAKQIAARNLFASKLLNISEVGVFLASSLEAARSTSKQYSRWCKQSGHRCENWMKNVTRADASLRRTRAPLPSVKDRTNHPIRLCRSCLASSSVNVELRFGKLPLVLQDSTQGHLGSEIGGSIEHTSQC